MAFAEWSAPGVPPASADTVSAFSESAWLGAQLAHRQVIAYTAAGQLPEEARAWESLRLDDSAPLVLAPLHAGDSPRGALICADIRRGAADTPHDEQSLEVVAGLLSGLLERQAHVNTLERQVAERSRELSIFLDMGLLGGEERTVCPRNWRSAWTGSCRPLVVVPAIFTLSKTQAAYST